jgi:surface polysaccharide O-acyltransferase-like enzyme
MSQRNNSIESLRFIAAFAVICIHYFYTKDKQVTLIVNQWARFAVPFFFVVSGYFLSEKLKKGDTPKVYFQFIKKLLTLYVAWQIIYFLNPSHHGEIYIRGIVKAYSVKLHSVTDKGWGYTLFAGWAQHLWFFFSLAQTALVFLLFRLKRIYWFVGLSAILYFIGALTKAYVKTKIGIPVSSLGFPKDFNTNNLIFFSALPFSLGVLWSVKNLRVGLIGSFVILITGYALHYTEVWYLGTLKLHQRIDYGFSTFLVGLGVFLVGLNRFKLLEFKYIANLGKFSLGIYAMHVLIATYVNESFLNYLSGPAVIKYKEIKFILVPVTTLIVCTLVTWGLSKIPVVKRLV